MGKSASRAEYRQAQERIANCPVTNCRNRTDDQNDEFCVSCKSANRVKKEYERTAKSQPEKR